MQPNIHTLASGATVMVTSPGHGFRFSDGTASGPQHQEVCDRLTCGRETQQVAVIHGMIVNEMRMTLTRAQLDYLAELSRMADVVMVSFPVLTALRDPSCWAHRAELRNVVAMNATVETQRSAPADKVVDLQNWSY